MVPEALIDAATYHQDNRDSKISFSRKEVIEGALIDVSRNAGAVSVAMLSEVILIDGSVEMKMNTHKNMSMQLFFHLFIVLFLLLIVVLSNA